MKVDIDLVIALGMLIGLVGILVPFVPGLPLIVVSALVWASASGDAGRWIIFSVVATIAIAAMLAGSIIPARRATAGGAPWWVLVAGVGGLVLGAILIPVIGAFVGWPLGILVAEWIRTHDLSTARRTTRDTLAGLGLAIAVQFSAGVLSVAIWAVAAWRW